MIFISNWKMKKSFTEQLTFVESNKKDLNLLANPQKKIILCPSFPALYPLAQMLVQTPIEIGAQDCSPHESGSYTGQVSATSLAQVGCSYCIVGHSEQRALGLTNQNIAEKINRLNTQNIIPIICIGESKTEYEQNKTEAILLGQLESIRHCLGTKPSIIAYEPIWAIGTGTTPDPEYLSKIFSWLGKKNISNTTLIYGGSVNEENIAQLLQIELIEGFLIGSASLNFQKFQKIVSLA